MNIDFKDVEIFEAGTQTDSEGKTQEWTVDDLNHIAEQYNAKDPENNFVAPAVLGHPEDNAPAYGWLGKLKVVGEKLIGDFHNCAEEFVQWVKERRYANRSISLDENGNVRHVGWLGAVPPAVKSLEPLKFAQFTVGQKSRVFSFADGVGTVPTPEPSTGNPERLARSQKYGIAVVPSQGYDTIPPHFQGFTEEHFGDPVNIRFPLTEEYIDASTRMFSKDYIQEQYNEQDRTKITTRIILGAVKYGFQIPSWCYNEKTKGSYTFNFGEKNFVHVPAELLTRQQLLKVVNAATQPAPVPEQPIQQSNSSPTNQEFAEMTEQQIVELMKPLQDFVTTSQPPEVATVITAEIDKVIQAIKDAFAAEAATPPTPGADMSEVTPPATDPILNSPQFAEMQRKFNELQAKTATLEADKRMNEHRSFADAAFKAGKILPTQQNLVVELREALHIAAPGTFSFSEPNGVKKAKPVIAAFDGLINSLQQFNFSTGATPGQAAEPITGGSDNDTKIKNYLAANGKENNPAEYRAAYYILAAKGEVI